MYLQEIGFQVVDRAYWPWWCNDVNMATKIPGLIKVEIKISVTS